RALADAAAAADKTEREAAARRATKQAALRKQIAAAQAAERAANEEASRVEAARLAAAERKVEAERRDAQRREAARIEAARRDEERMAAERRQHAEAQRLAAAAEQARVRAEKKRREAQRASQAEEAERRAAELARLQAAAVEADRIATEKARLAEAQARLTAFEADCRARILAIIEPRPIRFSFARADVRAAARAQLREIASVAQSCPTVRFRVDGHTDANGDSFTNMWLSKERARSVVSLLARFGVEAQRITSAGFGEDRPISSNATRIGRQENRRIDFTVLTGRTAAVPSDVPKTVARRTD
ncbi:MAG: OmpA family protein, partial [Pseudomonadota bacterium]